MKNEYRQDGKKYVIQVPLPRGDTISGRRYAETTVDGENFARVARIPGCWRAYKYKGQYYVRSDHASGRVMLHRLIAQPGPGERTVHRDGNGLNNTWGNLVNALDVNKLPAPELEPTPVPNDGTTKSGVKGVTWHKPSSRWAATLFHEGRRYCLGYHETVPKAAAAIDEKKKELGVS